MKLKKIASLMLAGIMAVSMLAGCEGKSNSGDDNNGEVVVPVDSSFAAAVNKLLNTAQKNTLGITADSTLDAALNNVMDKISTHELAAALSKNGYQIGFVTNSDAEDFRHLMGLDDDASLTTAVNNSTDKFVEFVEPTGDANPTTVASANWKYFTKEADSAKTVVDLIVVDGDYTEEGLAETVSTKLKTLIVEERMPNHSDVINGNQYDYTYTGHIASVKVDNLRGDQSYYVVALEVTQTPTQVVNGN